MQAFFIYLFQVNIALALFYLLYAVAFKRDTFFRLRRLFLLSIVLFSLLYPFFAVPALAEVVPFSFSRGEEVRSEVLIDAVGWEVLGDEEVVDSRSISWTTFFVALYWAVTAAFILRFIVQLFSVYRVWKRSEQCLLMGNVVYCPDREVTPFSFFNWIFIYTDAYSEQELQQILLHENTHVKQWHSIDVLITELLCLFFWWNPFTWLLKREVIMNLEYLADSHVLHEGIDSREYQYHLLRLTYHESAVPIANNFNVSQLKQRIMMMNKTKSPALRVAKYLIALPLLFLFVVGNSVYAGQDESTRLSEVGNENIETVSLPQTNDEVMIAAQELRIVQESNVSLEPNVSQEPGEPVFEVVENAPEFPGGQEGLMKYLSENTRYPVEAQEKGVQGRVICRFVVKKDGSTSNVEVLRGVDPLLDAEAIRVIESMPAWKPGTQKDEAVNVHFTIPIQFTLSTGTKEDNEPGDAGKSDGEQGADENKKSAEFPGGEKAMYKYLAENIKYPVKAQEAGVQGLVSAVFSVDSKGKVTFVRFQEEVNALLGQEVRRVIEQMPDWTPATLNGEPTGMTSGLSFVFRLQGDGVKAYDDPTPENAVVVVGYAVKK